MVGRKWTTCNVHHLQKGDLDPVFPFPWHSDKAAQVGAFPSWVKLESIWQHEISLTLPARYIKWKLGQKSRARRGTHARSETVLPLWDSKVGRQRWPERPSYNSRWPGSGSIFVPLIMRISSWTQKPGLATRTVRKDASLISGCLRILFVISGQESSLTQRNQTSQKGVRQ